MENTNTKSFSDSILDFTKSTPNVSESVSSVSNAASSAASSATNAVEETGSGIFGFIASISWLTWLMIILVLAFLGFNIFSYLAQGTQDISYIFAPLLQKFFDLIYGTTNQTIDVAAEGGKAVTTGTATGINTGLTAVQNVTPNNAKSSIPLHPTSEHEEEIREAENSLNKALNSSNNNSYKKDDDYEPQQASSSVHDTGKAGWCLIGEDRGYRTCSKVGENDKCMSGDIFPTQQLCVNPNLRA
jgi:hypothetical protein